ncbi:MAG TPA: replicative DNA helicase [bacterium]|nr:replicative DNA helicase [bacterium]
MPRKFETNNATADFQSVPPHNIEAEEAILGALLIDSEAVVKVADILDSDCFYKEAHGMIYAAMMTLYQNREPIDILSLSNKLEEQGVLKQIGGRSFLANLAEKVPTAANIVNYAKIVREKATRRNLMQSSRRIGQIAGEEDEIDVLLDRSEQELFKVTQRFLQNNFIKIKDVLSETFARIDFLNKNSDKLRGIPTGFTDLDKKLAGLQKTDLIILAARPAMGKTSLALDIARNAAKQNHPVALFSLEMGKDQLVDRMLCSEAGIDLWKLRTGKLSDSDGDDDFPRLGHAMGVLSEIPLFIDDSAGCNIMEIRTKARRLQAEHGLALIVIDYLQLMESRASYNENRVNEIAQISRGLKQLARELNIPVLALSQLSRLVEMEKPPIPKLSHLRESGSIEQDADIVMFVYREEYYNKETPRKGVADIIIAKHRNGPTGTVELYFDQTKASFKNLDRTHEQL